MNKENLQQNLMRTAKKLSIPRHSLDYWRSKGLLQHKYKEMDFGDLVRARFIKQCRESGISLQSLTKIKNDLGNNTLEYLTIYLDQSLVLKDENGLLNITNNSQFLIDFEQVKENKKLNFSVPSKTENEIKIAKLEKQYQEILQNFEEHLEENIIEHKEKQFLNNTQTKDNQKNIKSKIPSLSLEEIILNTFKSLENILKEILEIEPLHLMAWVELGNLYFKNNDYKDARKSYEAAITIHPQCLEALYNLANLHFREKRYAVSIRMFQTCIKVDPNFEEAYYNFGLVLFHLRCYKASKDVLEAYLDLDQNSHWSDQARLIIEEINSHKLISKNDLEPCLF